MIWLPVVGYEGLYEVSEQGHVRSLDRTILGNDGITYPFKGKILRPTPNPQTNYLMASLWKNNEGTSFYIHRLVATSFVPNPHSKPEVNHIDGNRQNNNKCNLEWVTSSENSFHAVQTALRVYTNKMTKEEFYDCLNAVINGESYQSVSTRTPYKVPFLSTKVRKLTKELGLEGELDESLKNQRIIRARLNGAKNSKNF